MRWAKAILAEIFGLFVDDGRFAGAIVLWVLMVWLARQRLGLPRTWGGVALFAGLVIILVASAARRSTAARQSRR